MRQWGLDKEPRSRRKWVEEQEAFSFRKDKLEDILEKQHRQDSHFFLFSTLVLSALFAMGLYLLYLEDKILW